MSFTARAQKSNGHIVTAIDQVQSNTSAALELMDYISKLPVPLEDDNIKYIAGIDYDLRYELATSLEILKLTHDDQIELAQLTTGKANLVELMIKDFGIEALPKADDIVMVDFEEISETVQSMPCDRFKATVLIILDAVGLADYEDLFVEIIRNTPVQNWVEMLVEGYDDRNWEDSAASMITLIIGILGVITTVEFVGRLLKIAGKEAANAMLKRFTLILVPYVGIVYAVAMVSASLKKNWTLLTC